MDVVKICEVVDGCEDCPKYGDDCDGDKMTEHTEYISRADAINAVRNEYEDAINIGDNGDAIAYDVGRILSALPSAKYFTEKPNDAVKASNDVINRADAIEAIMKYKIPFSIQQEVAREIDALPSADAVKVAYICDGRKCDKDCSECFRTLDIEHAKDFKLIGGVYYQQESAVPNCQKCAIKELWEATEKEDLVSVVRCKDCRHLYNKDFCSFFGSPTDAMDYCSHGERREE